MKLEHKTGKNEQIPLGYCLQISLSMFRTLLTCFPSQLRAGSDSLFTSTRSDCGKHPRLSYIRCDSKLTELFYVLFLQCYVDALHTCSFLVLVKNVTRKLFSFSFILQLEKTSQKGKWTCRNSSLTRFDITLSYRS